VVTIICGEAMSANLESKVKAILPAPFDWREIPAGQLILPTLYDFNSGEEERSQKVKVLSFSIAKYPITNAQFAKFIEAGGYQKPDFWTKAGWKARQSGVRMLDWVSNVTGKAWTEPLFWADEQWNGADYPVVGISWYEAFAFCRWLSVASGATISLPTAAQWQRAAQGDATYTDHHGLGGYPGDITGSAYPWGNDWDASRCNHNVDGQGIGRTTPVTEYEGKGDSPFGVVDMAGNVSEWCLTTWSLFTKLRGKNSIEGEAGRLMRGASWADGTFQYESRWTSGGKHPTNIIFRADFHQGEIANLASNKIGFRIINEEKDSPAKSKTRQKSKRTEAGLLPSSISTTSGSALLDSKVKTILPAPFDWCEIPAGKVTITKRRARHKGETFELPAFYIAKYPITNAQYAQFIEAGGYTNQQWWTEAGWAARNQNIEWDSVSRSFKPSGVAWTGPQHWQNPLTNGAEQPAISVSWYEAIAFCQWLSAVSGEKIMLPTLQQWQRAAQGDDGRTYPWGSQWDASRCNNNVNNPANDRTTPVTHYEGKGDSPFGLVDMVGNTYEWTLTAIGKGSPNLEDFNNADYCFFAGSSWMSSGLRSHRIDEHSTSQPYSRGNTHGFRIARAYE
jgi:formylglycine-generating enzyme required for sulfatase activity